MLVSMMFMVVTVVLALAGVVRAIRRGGLVVWRERILRMFGLMLALTLASACQATQRAQAATWLDRAIMSVCATYPMVRPRVMEIADSAPPEPAAEMDAGVDAGSVSGSP